MNSSTSNDAALLTQDSDEFFKAHTAQVDGLRRQARAAHVVRDLLYQRALAHN